MERVNIDLDLTFKRTQNKFDSLPRSCLLPGVNSRAMDDDNRRHAVETLEVEDEEHRQARIRMLRAPGYSGVRRLIVRQRPISKN